MGREHRGGTRGRAQPGTFQHDAVERGAIVRGFGNRKRRRGYSTEDAEDLTQDFFTSLLQGPLLQRADPERGRFRSLLLKALQDFLGHAVEKSRTQKRGGGVKFVSWDDWMAEAPSQ